ncbi:hypothetical protein CAPTEDRAFT_138840 [Capitella teleta]|uniref:Pyridoxal phosphate homeostasis protein n=1 Tax=Capitella teleta TaxID=283909 RepID=R7VGV4_CAPTE|nr:hypothetical protein CAPTEDRAFT_138840 [Capitella teleta]|eukprot:ELU14925.1 hypothetical protein CAPTEDRAFT_138840 [Capitella teleta]
MADNIDICRNLKSVLERMAVACSARPKELQHIQPRLVAVTKTKPVSMVKDAYACGQRHFGENYVNELLEKSADQELIEKCPEIHWHFIGHLQRNKVNKVLAVPNLYMVETIDSEKLASACNAAWERLENPHRLKVMVQINTSEEKNKHGVRAKEALDLAAFVRNHCPQLELAGFMTIGAFDHDLSKGPNPDFQNLIKIKDTVCSALKLDPLTTELSMGMSNDFEHAIINGSSNVRVGSTLFGARVVKKALETTQGNETSEKSTN